MRQNTSNVLDTIVTTLALLIGGAVFLVLHVVGAQLEGTDSTTTTHMRPVSYTEPDPVPGIGTVTRDGLAVRYDQAPADLWNGLIDQRATYHDAQTGGYGIQTVELGTVVPFPDGLFLATGDGWMGCLDWATFDGECHPTGPVEPITPCPAEHDVLPAAYDATANELVVVEDETPAEIWNALRAAGWTGMAGDGQSALYIPHGVVVDTTDGPMVASASGWVKAQI